MTRREFLQERYEDALFALLMDAFAVSEGKLAFEENLRLKEDPSAQVPDDIQKSCLTTIRANFTKKTISKLKCKTLKIINKTALIAMLCVILFTTAYATSESFRRTALNFVIEVFDDRTDFSMGPRIDVFSTLEGASIITDWLPEGCVLDSQNVSSKVVWYTYSLPDEGHMEITIYLVENSVTGFDTENALVEYCVVQGKQAMHIKKGEVVQIVWTDEAYGLIWEIYSTNVSDDMLFQVAENVSIK